MQTKGTSAAGGDMDNRVNIPLTTYLRRVANVDYLFGIKILLSPNSNVNQAADNIRAILRERHRVSAGIPDDFRVVVPEEVTEMAAKIAGTFSVFLVLVAGISLITGGVVVANIMLISVSERKNEIGLRMALGARSKDIKMQFLLEAVAVTIAGGAIGIVFGGISARSLQMVSGIPVAISWQVILLGVVLSSLVGIAAGMQPAGKAAKLQPVEAMRS